MTNMTKKQKELSKSEAAEGANILLVQAARLEAAASKLEQQAQDLRLRAGAHRICVCGRLLERDEKCVCV